ncbi:C45 family peptidase [Halobacillus litoralis]|uniref:C45 family autoproteolytic acyltransferase/hydolase n=1 Tax=Halobacillus litoralis TaxID=45668 RepID=UPI001CD26276|nr:C45 family peptidase [Halobacillus litoralis]MCA0969185.1 C45 family peptidase [Halobacillus litoralis]
MSELRVDVHQYRSTSYEMGREQAEQLNPSIYDKFSVLSRPTFHYDDMLGVYQEHAPHLLDELKGLSDGSGLSMKETASLFSGYDLPEIPAMGCSSVVNSDFAVRNYDFSPVMYDQRFVLSQPEGKYASVGHSLHVLGRHEGVNEKGLFMALHFVSMNETAQGLSASAIVRVVLDTCATTDEAIEKLRALPHAWCYNFSIGDSNGRSVVVEASPSSVEVREGTEGVSCTNHFHKNVDLNRTDMFGSTARYEAMTERDESFDATFHWFMDRSSVLFFEQYDQFFGTLHTFGYDFTRNVVKTAVAGGGALTVDWQKWLEGEDLQETCLVGKLNQPI